MIKAPLFGSPYNLSQAKWEKASNQKYQCVYCYMEIIFTYNSES